MPLKATQSFVLGLRGVLWPCRLGAAVALAKIAPALGREQLLAEDYLLEALQQCFLALRTDGQSRKDGAHQQISQAIKVCCPDTPDRCGQLFSRPRSRSLLEST